MNSTHRVDVVEVKLLPHPNADTLSIVRVYGYQVCVRTSDWRDGELGAYIPPDSIVDSTRPEFTFLAGHERVKVKKLRQQISMGLLVKAPAGAVVGDDVAEALGVKHYVPPESVSTGGEDCAPPKGYAPCYDVESARRYAHAFVEGEMVMVTEKVHGANARYTFRDGVMYAGSRTAWKKQNDANAWWKALRVRPEIESWCRVYEGWTLYGEVYGQVQDLRYGKSGVDFAAFDVLMPDGQWMNAHGMRMTAAEFDVPLVPLIEVCSWSPSVLDLAEGLSLIEGANHVREGCVIKPLIERTHPEFGRVNLKVVGNGYLERA